MFIFDCNISNTTAVPVLVLLVQSFLNMYTDSKVSICIWTGASIHSQFVLNFGWGLFVIHTSPWLYNISNRFGFEMMLSWISATGIYWKGCKHGSMDCVYFCQLRKVNGDMWALLSGWMTQTKQILLDALNLWWLLTFLDRQKGSWLPPLPILQSHLWRSG